MAQSPAGADGTARINFRLTPPASAAAAALALGRSSSTPAFAPLSSPGGLKRLRISCARWADAFDKADDDKDGILSFPEAVKAFRDILGGDEVPQVKLKMLLERGSPMAAADSIDFPRFHGAVKAISQWMSDNPSWRDLEHKAEIEELARARELRERKRKESMDLFNILGMSKPQDVKDAEMRKTAMGRVESMPRLCSAGASLVESPKVVRRSLVSLQAKRATISEGSGKMSAAKFRDANDRGKKYRDPIFNRVKTIDVATDVRELKVRGYGSGCLALRFSPDGSRLAGGYFDGALRVFDAEGKTQISTLNMARPHVNALILPDMPTYKRDALAMPQDNAIMNLRWCPSVRRLLLALVDITGAIGIWDLSKARPPALVSKLPGTGELNAMAFTEDQSRLLAAGAERVIKTWEFREGGMELSQTVGEQTSVMAKIVGHSGKIVSVCSDPTCPSVMVSGGIDKRVLVWDLRAGKGPIAKIQGVELAGDSLDISADGKTLLAGSHRSGRTLQLFDLRTTGGSEEAIAASQSFSWSGAPCGPDDGPVGASSLSCAVFSACWDKGQNRMIAAAGEKDGLGQVFRRRQESDSLEVVSAVMTKSAGALYSASVSEDGRMAAFGAADGAVQICDLR